MIRVGVWTFGITLCVIGGALLGQNLTGKPVAYDLTAWWGAIPLLFGLELLISHAIASSRSGDRPLRVRLHGGSLAGLIVVLVIGTIVNVSASFGFPWIWDLTVGDQRIGVYRHAAEAELAAQTDVSEDINAVSVNLPPGDWTITGADADQALVTGGIEVRGRSTELAETGAAGARVVYTVENGTLHIGMDIPGYAAGGFTDVQVRSDATITLPRKLALTVESRLGDVDVSGFLAGLTVSSSVGDVVVRDITGKVDVEVSTGYVRVEDVRGALDVEASTGTVEVVRVSGDVRVDGQTGRIRVSEPGAAVYIDVSTGSCVVESSSPVAGQWSVESTTGSVAVSFPRSSDVDIRASAALGSISNNLGLPSQSGIGQKSTSGTLGAGTHAVRLDASTGSISITGTD